jgi:TonB family protein
MISKRLQEQGVTVLMVEIGADGSVLDDYVRRSSLSERLDQAAMDFVKQNWRWQPPSSKCRPVAAVTEVVVGWSLTRNRGDIQTANPRPLGPLPTSFYSLPPEQQKLGLARYLIAQMHRARPPQKMLDLVSASVEEKFKAKLSALPDAQQRFATAAFQNALDETFNARLAVVDAKFAKSLADHMDTESMKALVAFYATPLGQKALTTPEAMTPEDKRTMGALFLAHPDALELPVTQLRMFADEVRTMKEDGAAFAHDFRLRLCPKLASFNIRDSDCLRPMPLSPPTLQPEACDQNQCPGRQSSPKPEIQKSENVEAPSATFGEPPSSRMESPASQSQDSGCSASEREVAELARQNGYRYSGICK